MSDGSGPNVAKGVFVSHVRGDSFNNVGNCFVHALQKIMAVPLAKLHDKCIFLPISLSAIAPPSQRECASTISYMMPCF